MSVEISAGAVAPWLSRLYDLRRDMVGDHERPHKPVLLLAIMDLVDQGLISDNIIPLTEALVARFRELFEVVALRDDRPTIQNPYFHLSGDGFWHLEPRPGESPVYCPGDVGRSPSIAQLRRRVSHGRFEPDLWNLIAEPVTRLAVREALLARYFPGCRNQLRALAAKPANAAPNPQPIDDLPGRDAAFRRLVLEVYDHRCAACGVRVLVTRACLVEAVHLVPFSETRDDRPANGIALCPNHHWAMDRNFIAPCPDAQYRAGIWRVHADLDDRIDHQRELFALRDRRVIEPGEEKFAPAPESLEWRRDRLESMAIGIG